MLPKGARKVITDENLKIDSYDKKELKKKMLEQGVYSKEEIEDFFNEKSDIGLPQRDLDNLGINKTTAFFEFYSEIGFPPKGKGEELYTLDQIIENMERVFPSGEYPEIGKRYLQLTSIEGEGSYFYDKETDSVYDVDWGEEADMVSGKKEPWFNSFYDFLEWYYNDIEVQERVE